MSLIFIAQLFFLSLPILAKNYTNSGTDWTDEYCIPKNNPILSPIQIEPSQVYCNSGPNIDVYQFEKNGVEFLLTYEGDPKTIRLTVSNSTLFSVLFYKTTNGTIFEYNFEELVFRTPTEHVLANHEFLLEGQFKYQLDKRFEYFEAPQKLVTSIMFYNTTNPSGSIFNGLVETLNKTEPSVVEVSNSNNPIKFTIADFRNSVSAFIRPMQFLYYNGTITDGNCFTNVTWIILDQNLPANMYDFAVYTEFLNKLSDAPTNSRNVYNVNKVKVFHCGQQCDEGILYYVWFFIFYTIVLYFGFNQF